METSSDHLQSLSILTKYSRWKFFNRSINDQIIKFGFFFFFFKKPKKNHIQIIENKSYVLIWILHFLRGGFFDDQFGELVLWIWVEFHNKWSFLQFKMLLWIMQKFRMTCATKWSFGFLLHTILFVLIFLLFQ